VSSLNENPSCPMTKPVQVFEGYGFDPPTPESSSGDFRIPIKLNQQKEDGTIVSQFKGTAWRSEIEALIVSGRVTGGDMSDQKNWGRFDIKDNAGVVFGLHGVWVSEWFDDDNNIVAHATIVATGWIPAPGKGSNPKRQRPKLPTGRTVME
jgi:hypothetical protein